MYIHPQTVTVHLGCLKQSQMKEINIIPIEEHQPSLAEDYISAASELGLIDALKQFAGVQYKKDRKVKITKSTDSDGDPYWTVRLIVRGEDIWHFDSTDYEDANRTKKKVEAWAKENCPALKDFEKYVVWESWNTATSGNVSQIHVTRDGKTTLCNKKIPYAGEYRSPAWLPEGSLHSEKLGDIPNTGWDAWWFKRQGKNERTISVSCHDAITDFDYQNNLGTRLNYRRQEKCSCCLKRSRNLRRDLTVEALA